MSAQQVPGPLSADCMRILEQEGVEVEQSGVGIVDLLDASDGEWLFRVTEKIDVYELRTLLRLHRRRFDEGMKAGREAAFGELRALIGVSDAEERGAG